MTTEESPASSAAAAASGRSFTRYFPVIARVLLGLMFFVFGLNGFLNFIPKPPTPGPEGAELFGAALMKTGYMFPLIKGTETLVGALLLLNRFVPLALVVIAPVIVNIVAFHVFLAPASVVMALVILALEIYLAWAYRRAYVSLLTPRAVPA